MQLSRRALVAGLGIALAATTLACSGDDDTGPGANSGYDPSGTPAVLWITTDSPMDPDDIGEDEVAGSLRIIEQHDGTHADPMAFASMPAALEVGMTLHTRGNSSLMFPKKNFALELQGATDQIKLPVLGMPKEADWVLHGPYSDKTYLRNVLAYWLGREIYRGADGNVAEGRWNPRTRFAELYINEQYWGVYIVIERVKADADRVDVDRPGSAAFGDLTGGYIVRREGHGSGEADRDWVSTTDQTIYTHHFPRSEDITPEQRDYIRDYFNRFEAMMHQDDWNDPAAGYPAWIEMTSWLDYSLAMEWSNNVDGFYKSVYFVKQADSRGGKLSLTPLWDFNIAFGNADYRNGDDTTNWVHRMSGTEPAAYDPPGEVPFLTPYFQRLVSEPQFLHALKCRWQALRSRPLATARITAQIDAWADQLALAEQRDHQRWPVLGEYVWPNPEVHETYAEEVSALKRFVEQRFAFLDGGFEELAPGPCQ